MKSKQSPNTKPSNAIWRKCLAKTKEDDRKPFKSVIDHAMQTAAVVKALKDILPHSLEKLITNEIIAIAALHDLGKISPGFQKHIHSEHFKSIDPKRANLSINHFETNHAMIGAMALDSYFQHRSSWSEIIALHHGSIIERYPRRDGGEKFGGSEWADARRLYIEAMFQQFGSIKNRKLDLVQRNFYLGLITLSDWIASDESLFPDTNSGLKQAEEALTECGFIRTGFKKGLSFSELFSNQPYKMQQSFIDAVKAPGLYVLEAPMGMGKTEAALYAAYQLMAEGHHHGLYFGLPTRLTSNKIFERVDPFLQKICLTDHRPKLAHGTAWLKSFGTGGEELSAGKTWFDSRKRTLLYPFAVGTIDQALLGVLRVKHFFLRSFGLAGKVVILDEVHSYDMYTGSLMEELVHQLLDLHCTVIVLSATLTHERTKRLFPDAAHIRFHEGYPLITSMIDKDVQTINADSHRDQTYLVEIYNWDNEEIANKAVKQAETNQCVLCITNTVARAQQWYDKIKSLTKQGEYPIGLIHSKFPAFRRKELEDDWIDKLGREGERPERCILIATQVVEQSVDIDADCLITELAPTDMLLQRMGRQWRHDRQRHSDLPETYIISGDPTLAENREEMIEALGKTNCLVYSPYVLYWTYDVWKTREKMNLPNDIRKLLEKTYEPHSHEHLDEIKDLQKLHQKKCDHLRRIANANLATVTALPTGDDKEGYMTRYNDLPTLDLLLVKKCDSTGRRAMLTLLDGMEVTADANKPDLYVTRLLHQNTVTLAAYKIRNAGIAGPKAEFLQKHFYNATPVLEWDEQSGCLLFEGRETGFVYTNERGVSQIITGVEVKRSTYSDYEGLDILSDEW